jgi:2-iminoacetate synthase ThiH
MRREVDCTEVVADISQHGSEEAAMAAEWVRDGSVFLLLNVLLYVVRCCVYWCKWCAKSEGLVMVHSE